MVLVSSILGCNMCHLQWSDPVWDKLSNQKHRRAQKRSWDRSITTAWTGEPDEPSQFNPHLSDAQIEEMELACIRDGDQIQDKCHKRTYWARLTDVIGASAGEKTQFLYVEYLNTGNVHGWPITE